MCYALTEYSDTLPEASLTPPPNTVLEVLWICGVLVRVLLVVEVPPFRMTVPRSQLPDLDMSQISPESQNRALVAGGTQVGRWTQRRGWRRKRCIRWWLQRLWLKPLCQRLLGARR